MAKITFLGTANAISSKDHENTYFLVEGGGRKILVDCAGNPISRLDQAGIDPLHVTDLILTHFHPDHVSGVPLFLMDLWLKGRKDPLNIFAQADNIKRVKAMMDIFEWQNWEGFFPISFKNSLANGQITIYETDRLKIQTSQLCHLISSIGVRMEFPEGILCYSSDTEPCDALIHLAKNADILIHEATGEGEGHSSPEQAGEVAQLSGVKKLILVHYPADIDPEEWINKAKADFSGDVIIAEDFQAYSL